MTAFSPIQIDRATPVRAGTMPLAIALLLTLAITLARLTNTVDSDVAWQLWIAGRIHAGANLYTDIIETNPPLWFWMAVPVARAADILHVPVEHAMVVAIGGVIALSIAATDRLIRHIEPKRRAFVLGYAALALGVMPWLHTGQREQIVLIGAVPYAALLAARRKGDAVNGAFAAAVGTGAALGFALKHYFLIVPAVLELWLIVGVGRRWRPLRPETVAMVVTGAVYAAAIVFFERDFLFRIVPLLRLAYGVFGAPSLLYLFGPYAVLGLMILGVLVTQARRLASDKAPVASALALAAAAFGIIYFVQLKGWAYHALPMIGCGSLALATLLVETSAGRTIRLVGPTILALPLFLAAQDFKPAEPSADLQGAVAGLPPGATVGFLTTETAIPWSVTLQGHYRYASRYMGFWMMRAIIRNERSGNPDRRLEALGHQIVAETVRDFTCAPPARIIVFRPRPGQTIFDILPFFLRDPQFEALLSHYRVRSRTSLETYERLSPLPAPTAACRKGV